MLPFYVIGHKNPDTDAICSAIGYAELLRAVGEEPQALAARCGEISQNGWTRLCFTPPAWSAASGRFSRRSAKPSSTRSNAPPLRISN